MRLRTILAMLIVALVSPAAAQQMGHPHSCTEFYPPEAVEQNHEGSISLAITITAEGTVRDPRILNSSGYPELDAAALACVRGWLYKPAMKNGNPVTVESRTRVQFGASAGDPESIRDLSADVRRCVRESQVIAKLPDDFMGITDIAVMFPPDTEPHVTVIHASGLDALDAKAAACVKASSALTKAAAALRGRNWVLSYSWAIMRSMGSI